MGERKEMKGLVEMNRKKDILEMRKNRVKLKNFSGKFFLRYCGKF